MISVQPINKNTIKILLISFKIIITCLSMCSSRIRIYTDFIFNGVIICVLTAESSIIVGVTEESRLCLSRSQLMGCSTAPT